MNVKKLENRVKGWLFNLHEKNIMITDFFIQIIVDNHVNVNKAKKNIITFFNDQNDTNNLSRNIRTKLLTQLPLIAQAFKAVYVNCWDQKFILDNMPIVRKLYDNFLKSHMHDGDKIPLLNVIHARERGALNPHFQYKASNFKCKDLLFNCIVIQGYRDLAFLYGEIGDRRESNDCKSTARALEKLVLKNCWDSNKNMFFGLCRNNLRNEIKTSSSFSPLILDGLPQNLACKTIDDHLLCEEEFWTEFPVPSVAIDESLYSENDYFTWRGPTNIFNNWIIIKGLKKHGFENIAIDLAKKTMDLVKKSGFRECYSPTTGMGMGTKNYTASKLIIDIEKSLLSELNADLDFLLNREYLRIKKGGFNN